MAFPTLPVTLPRGAALSHTSAARYWGIELVGEVTAEHVTVPRNSARTKPHGLIVHRADLAGDDVEERDGIRITCPLRTVVDLARVLPVEHAVAAADSALRRGLVSKRELRAAAEGLVGRGAARVRQMVRLADGRAESVLESLGRVLFVLNGLAPMLQWEVFDGARFVARVDFAWPQLRVAVEVDGFAHHSDRESYRRDRERLNELERLGWRVLRFTWEDIVGRPDYVLGLVRSLLDA